MLVGKPEVSTKVAEDFVTKLTGICPVYYANGNHEQRMKIYPEKFGTKYQEYKTSVEQSGVQFLENEHIDLMFDACPIQIHGLEIPRKVTKSSVKQKYPWNRLKSASVKRILQNIKSYWHTIQSMLTLILSGGRPCIIRSFTWRNCTVAGTWWHDYTAVSPVSEIFR